MVQEGNLAEVATVDQLILAESHFVNLIASADGLVESKRPIFIVINSNFKVIASSSHFQIIAHIYALHSPSSIRESLEESIA